MTWEEYKNKNSWENYKKRVQEQKIEEQKKIEQKQTENVNLPKTEKRTWLSKGAFSDGYQVGDIYKTTKDTALDVTTNLVKGVARAGESLGDLLAYGGAQVADWFGAKDYANQVRKAAAEDLTGKVFKPVENNLTKNSILGAKSDDVVSSIGNMYAQAVTSAKLLGGKGNIPLNIGGKKFNLPVTSIISGASSGMGEAVNKNAEDWQIWANGITSGLSEGLSESLFGTFGIGGSDLDDAIVKGITKNMKNGLVKSLTKAGIKAAGEGAEEVASYLLNQGSQRVLDFAKNKMNIKGVDLADEFSSNEMWENFFAGALAAGIGGLPSTIGSIRGTQSSGININEGVNQFNKDNGISQQLNTQQNNQSNEKYSQNSNTNQNLFQFEKDSNVKINNFKESASKYFNNSEQTHNFIDNISKIISDKDYNVIFDDKIVNNKGQSVNAQIKLLANGETEIKINPNSPKSGEFLIIHEVTHSIETNEMKELVLDYASKHNDFNQALNELKATYGTNDVSSEVLADISGQLFGNQEFINNLSLEKPNVFKRIYNSIISLANKITGNSHEALFIKDLKNKWETAYRNNANENVSNLKFSKQYYENIGTIAQYDGINYMTNPKENIQKNIKDYFNNNFKGLEINQITTDQGRKYAYPGKKQDNYVEVKAPAVTIMNDIMETMTNKKHQLDMLYNKDGSNKKHSKLDTTGGFNHYDVKIGIPDNKGYVNIYSADSITRIDKNGKEYFYDLDKIKNTGQKVVDNKSKPIADSSVSFNDNNITQSKENVKLPTKYSMQNNQNNVQELNNSSFSFDENARRYEELKITNNIEFFKKENGDIRVSMLDSNSNLVNQLDIYSKQDSIKQFGENIGNYIYTQASDDFNKIYIGNDINNTGSETDYFMNHRPTETGLTADNLINQDAEMSMPTDVYEHPEYYSGTGSQYLRETMQSLNKVRNKPDAKVTIYRATTGNKINKGDWVTLSKGYAENHNKSNLNGKGNIISLEVKARDIQFAGDDLNEFGYFPNGNIKNSISNTNKWQKYLDKNYKPTGTRTNMNDIKIPTKKDISKINVPPVENILNADKNISPTKEEAYINDYSKKITRKEVRKQLIEEMDIMPSELSIGNDIKSINYQLTDPIRINEKVFGQELGKKINDATINKTKHNTAEKTRWLNQQREEIKNLGIKARSKESAAVQKYAEGKYVSEKGESVSYGDRELKAEFPDIKTQEKIKNASKFLRKKYDTYINQINEVITSLGYDAIPKRKDYMRHFQELGDVFSKTGIPFNLNDMKAEDLPTDINGLTEFNRPGKNWFANAQQRTGIKTTYDAITGIDGYLEGAGNLIYHTADIQRYRALSGLIRDTFGQTKGFENLDDLSGKELQQRIKDIQDNKLSKYVAWLDEQANNLAGKKGAIDRGVERAIGRRGYTFFNTIKKQVGSNMTGYNVRSSLTNLISSTIAGAKTNKIALIKGTVSTVNNMLKNDNFIDKSDFLTNRFGSDSLSTKWWQKAANAGQVFMTGTDYLTSNIIVRSKYFEGLQKGLNETDAIKYADDFASRVMGDRSQGSTAEIFNSKTLGLFTQFQLEVNNQWQYMIHDSKMDYQSNSKINGGLKAGATILFQLGQLAAYSYFFNELFEKLTGSRAAFDPIEILKKLFGWDDDKDDKEWDERLGEAGSLLIDNIPFGNIITGGGRIPISEAFTGISTLGKKLTNQKDDFGNEITWNDVGKDILETIPYYVMPTGYSQAKKTLKGLDMYNKKFPIAGSYTDSGNLRFNADETTSGKIKSALFGQYSGKEAQEYIDSGFKTISKNNIQEMNDLDMTSSEYREYRTGLSQSGTTNKEKMNYISNLDNVTDNQKSIMASNLLQRKVDIKEYQKYNSYEEYDYAYKNPEKYSVITNITTYDKYQTYKKELEDIRDNSNDKKNDTINYVNSLKLNIPQKAMFIKQYYKSFDDYNEQIVNYIKEKNLSTKEKENILTNLGFTIKDGRVYW